MKVIDDYRAVPPVEVFHPRHRSAPFVFSAPHSGTAYPRAFLQTARLDRHTLRRSEDSFVDELFAGVVLLGAPLVKANFPRVYVDVNRAEDELDPRMFAGRLSLAVAGDSPRVAGGLGVIARVVGERQEIYARKIPAEEAATRLACCYRPYHATLCDEIAQTLDTFDHCVLVDCHSMPSGAVRATGERDGIHPDIILGDRFGTSCAPELSDIFAAEFRREGFVVGRNRPYAGGHITEHYGKPPSVHALQLEINRGLYMDEGAYARSRAFEDMKASLEAVCGRAIERFGRERGDGRWPLAAE